MINHPPLNPQTGLEDPTMLPWIAGNPATGTEGSYPGLGVFTDPQTEIVNVIIGAGIVPSEADLTQLLEAILALIRKYAPGSITYPTFLNGNTRLSSKTTGGLSLLNSSQALTCNQAATILWSTDVVPGNYGSYANGFYTVLVGGWHSITLAAVVNAHSSHSTDTMKVSANLLTTSAATGAQGGFVESKDATFPPAGAVGAGFTFAAMTVTRDLLLAAGDTIQLQMEVTSFYNDLTGVTVLGNSDLTIAYLNPDE